MSTVDARVGFIGLGTMGLPMARNLLRAGTALTVWNRSPGSARALEREGARRAATVPELFAETTTILLMLANGEALDDVLGRDGPAFDALVAGQLVVHTGTTSPEYSTRLAADVRQAGGRYVEAPVSGSRGPAEAGQLVGMVAGDPDDVETVRRLLAATCRTTFACGQPPQATRLKLAVNSFLISSVAALAEAVHLARRFDLDLDLFQEVLDAGPMASAVSTVKLAKMVSDDMSVQASIRDVRYNSGLVTDAARQAAAATPLLDVSQSLLDDVIALGLQEADMAALIRSYASR